MVCFANVNIIFGKCSCQTVTMKNSLNDKGFQERLIYHHACVLALLLCACCPKTAKTQPVWLTGTFLYYHEHAHWSLV